MSTDPHTRLAQACAEGLARRFPAAGIALAGSVAAGRHTSDSDVDLLVVDNALARDAQLAFHEDGIRANVLCVHPGRFGGRLRADAHRFVGVRLSYVLAALPLRDPRGHLAALQETARGILRERRERPGPLLDALRARADTLLPDTSEGVFTGAAAEALGVLADALLLRRGRTALDKREGRLFEALSREDPESCALVREVLEDGVPAGPALRRLYERAFGAAPPP